MDITRAFDILIDFEGTAFTNIKNDKGGATKFGISKAANPDIDVANLTQDKALLIYNTRYWIPGHCPDQVEHLQYLHFDTCVNMGIVEANKIMAYVSARAGLNFAAYLSRRSDVYDIIVKANPADKEFYEGWENRLARLQTLYQENKLI